MQPSLSLSLYMIGLLACFCLALANAESLNTVRELYDAVEKGPNRKVGFLTAANYQTVATILPSQVEPVIFANTENITNAILRGDILAGLISGIPPSTHGLYVFSSGIVSPRSFLFHPTDAEDLIDLIDAAIVRLEESGFDQRLARQNAPFEFVQIDTCKPQPQFFPFPTGNSLDSYLSDMLNSNTLKVAALGPFNWDQDGNYLVDPPTGFWPGYLEEIVNEINRNLNTSIKIERTFYGTSQEVLESVLAGTTHVTEPYFTVDSFFKGRARKHSFALSCIVLGYDSKFFSKRESEKGPVLSDAEIAGVVIAVVVAVLGVIAVAILIFKERTGRPLFMRLEDGKNKKSSVNTTL